jgi:hypothetical protein
MVGLETMLPPIFGFAGAIYLGLAVYVSRSSPQSVVGFLMFLMGVMVAGTAFSYGATDITLFNIGRVLNFAAAAFLPVAFYVVYRQFTGSPPNPFILALLLVIPYTAGRQTAFGSRACTRRIPTVFLVSQRSR